MKLLFIRKKQIRNLFNGVANDIDIFIYYIKEADYKKIQANTKLKSKELKIIDE